jgi:hypothetical protein
MKITCIRDGLHIKVELSLDDPLNILFDKLNITEKNTKLLYESHAYRIDNIITFREIGLKNNAEVMITTQLIFGGCENMCRFANLSEEFIRKDNVSKYNPNIPKWRLIGKGINLYGICQNSNCVAKGKQVIKHVDSKEYDVYNEGFMGICPMCNKHFDLDTCSFYHCDYKCEGTYFDKSKDNWVDLPGDIQKTSGGKDFYYDYNKPVRGKEGKVKYKKLVLKVIQYHDSEYDNK